MNVAIYVGMLLFAVVLIASWLMYAVLICKIVAELFSLAIKTIARGWGG